MPLMRTSFLFFQQGYGWSNTWFMNTTAADPYADVLAKALVLAQKMQGIMGNNTWINGWRVSDESIFRDVSLTFYGTGNVGLVGSNGQSAAPQNCLIYKHNPATAGAPSAYRPFRGLPVSMMQQGGIWTPTAGWTAANNSYRAQLAADAWGWRGATIRQQPRVQSVIQNGDGTVGVTLQLAMAGVPLNTPITVSIARVKGAIELNGVRQVIFTTPSVFSTVQRIAIAPYSTGGTVLWSQKNFVADRGTGNWQRMAERKPGRPFYLSRGRRQVRRSA